MLRALVAALLVANLVFWGWSAGWLDAVIGVPAHGDREPERLARQVHPERVVILSPDAVAKAPPSCLESGPYAAAEAASAAAALRSAAPDLAWRDVSVERPGIWTVYLGGFPERDAMLRREDELRRSGIDVAETNLPGESEEGLALGRYDERGAAEQALAQLLQRGVRGGRVLALAPATVTHWLRVDAAAPAVAARLLALKLEAPGRGFKACGVATASR